MENGEDVFQEVILAILEMPDTKLKAITDGGYMVFYALTMAGRIGGFQNKLSKYYNAKRERLIDVIKESHAGSVNPTEQICASIEIEKIEKALSKMHWYDRELFRLYMEEDSYRKVQALTGIHYTSVRVTVEKVRTKLKKICGY
jgi:RNA polymerase sigma factor (sigma-70 family)